MSSCQITLHIIYVHGFRGDQTTFQSFPTDLHNALLPYIPPNISLRSILYPTYKSRRPIAIATQMFLNWLESLPYGPLIICGHSMGGLLVAEAATSKTHSAAKRVIALIGFDVPFLGMHPHVVISGIASLLPKKKDDLTGHGSDRDKLQGGGLKNEEEMNDKRHVNVPVDRELATPSPVEANTLLSPSSLPGSHIESSSPRARTPSPAPGIMSRTLNFIESHSDSSFVRFISKHHADPFGAAKRWVVESFEFGACMFDPKGLRDRYKLLQRWDKPWVAFWTETMHGPERSHAAQMVTHEPVEDDVSTDVQEKHVKKGLHGTASLGSLEPVLSSASTDSQDLPGSSPSLLSDPSLPPLESDPRSEHRYITKLENKSSQIISTSKLLTKDFEARKHATKERKGHKVFRKQTDGQSPHHFVVRPFKAPSSPIHRWEQVKIHGANHEVEAHCGLFLRDMNLEYDAFVERVRELVRGWIEDINANI